MPESESPNYQVLVRFQEYFEFKTNGEIALRLFPGNQLGAAAVPINGVKAAMALRQGFVDGQENPPAVVFNGSHGEVQNHHTSNERTFGPHGIVANNDW